MLNGLDMYSFYGPMADFNLQNIKSKHKLVTDTFLQNQTRNYFSIDIPLSIDIQILILYEKYCILLYLFARTGYL